jgi:hypothetical protein
MKTITLLAVSIMLTASLASAKETKSFEMTDVTTGRYSFDEPISFTERGIEFFVFPNGDFDFNTRPNDSQGDYFFRGAGKKGSEKLNRGSVNYGVLIEHDSFGRVRRVGNTFINYDFTDRVSRIGSVFMRYNRFALSQIGGLKIVYDRRGNIVDMIGSVKRFGNQGFTNNYYTNDAYCDVSYDNHTSYNSTTDYYYYRADGARARIEEKK